MDSRIARVAVRSLLLASAVFVLHAALPAATLAEAPGAAEYARARAALEQGDPSAALAPLGAVRWHAEEVDLRRLAAVDLSRCEASLPDSFRWDYAVLPADNLGSPSGLEGLPFSLSWLLRDDLQAAGVLRVAPLARVVRALDRGRDAAFPAGSTPEQASRLPVQTVEGLKARLSLIPGATGRPLYVGSIDNEADPELRDAIRGLQAMVGAEPTGEADATTMGALSEVYEKRLLEPPAAADPGALASLAAAIPTRFLLRPTMRVREGRLVFGLVVLDDRGRPKWGPVESGGPLENAPGIVREALRALLDLLPAAGGFADLSSRVDPPSSLAEMQEAGLWALLRSRGEASLARTRGAALRDDNPGWDRVATTVDADQAGAATIAQWEEAWRRELLLLGSIDEQPLIDRIDRFVSDLPSPGAEPLEGRRGAVHNLGDEGRLRIEGRFP
jgi:hypothetical protein